MLNVSSLWEQKPLDLRSGSIVSDKTILEKNGFDGYSNENRKICIHGDARLV